MTPLEIEARKIFTDSDYSISDKHVKSAALDFIAIKSSQNYGFFLCKTLSSLDNFKKQHSIELKIISELFSGLPLLIAEKSSKTDPVVSNTIYMRHGIPSINIITLNNLLKSNLLPRFIAKRGGLFVRIDSEKFGNLQRDSGISISELSRESQIARKTLYSYIQEPKIVSKENIEKLSSIFNLKLEDITIESSVLEEQAIVLDEEEKGKITGPKNKLQEEINDVLQSIDKKPIESYWFTSVPFDGLSNVKETKGRLPINFVTGTATSSFSTRDMKRMESTASIIKILQDKRAVWISETENESIDKKQSPLVVLSIDELGKMMNIKELLIKLDKKRKEAYKKTKN